MPRLAPRLYGNEHLGGARWAGPDLRDGCFFSGDFVAVLSAVIDSRVVWCRDVNQALKIT